MVTICIVREEILCHNYIHWLAARGLVYAPPSPPPYPHRQDSTAFITPGMEYWLEWETAQLGAPWESH